MNRLKPQRALRLPRSLRMFVIAAGIALIAMSAAQAQRRGNFDDADTNHDGHITLPEYQAYMTNRLMAANGTRAQKFKELSPQDQAARLAQRFTKLDTGHKGYLDRNDWGGS